MEDIAVFGGGQRRTKFSDQNTRDYGRDYRMMDMLGGRDTRSMDTVEESGNMTKIQGDEVWKREVEMLE